MSVPTLPAVNTEAGKSPWRGFRTGLWQNEINVRDFIQQNYPPYDGDGSFLAPATARTQKFWRTLETLFVEERKKGVLDVSQTPGSITAHRPATSTRTTRSSLDFRPTLRSNAPSCRTAAFDWSPAR